MIKLNIINMSEFVQVVNGCSGAVKLLNPDGTAENINKQFELQTELRRRHRENKGYLPLKLDIRNPKDYMSIVSFTVGDC